MTLQEKINEQLYYLVNDITKRSAINIKLIQIAESFAKSKQEEAWELGFKAGQGHVLNMSEAMSDKSVELLPVPINPFTSPDG